MKNVSGKLFLLGGIVILSSASCSKERSPVTAWEYNNPKNGGFEVVPYEELIAQQLGASRQNAPVVFHNGHPGIAELT